MRAQYCDAEVSGGVSGEMSVHTLLVIPHHFIHSLNLVQTNQTGHVRDPLLYYLLRSLATNTV